MRYAAVILMLFRGVAAWGQPADASLTFEVASLKASPPPDGRGIRVGCNTDPVRITCTNMDLGNLITMAYGIAHYQLTGLERSPMDRYEIAVKVPDGAGKDQVKLMWQNLLAERFKLAVHRETRDAPVYELVVARGGLKMRESGDEPPPDPDAPRPAPHRPTLGADGFPTLGPQTSMAMMNGRARWHAPHATSAQIASMCAGQLGRPVTDATGLKGKYDVTLSWVTESFGGSRGGAATAQADGGSPLAGMNDAEVGPTFLTAIQTQLGLKLEQKKGSLEMLVVDHVEKVPTEN